MSAEQRIGVRARRCGQCDVPRGGLRIGHTAADLAMALQLARLIDHNCEIDWWLHLECTQTRCFVADWLRRCVEQELGR